jgi:hypothetical protein
VADLEFRDRAGARVTLSDLRARPGARVLLWSSGAEWCTVCRSKVPLLKSLQSTRGPRGLVVMESLHQSRDSRPADAATLDRWQQAYTPNYTLLIERSPPHEARDGNPLVFVIDARTMKIAFRESYSGTGTLEAQVDAALAAAGR